MKLCEKYKPVLVEQTPQFLWLLLRPLLRSQLLRHLDWLRKTLMLQFPNRKHTLYKTESLNSYGWENLQCLPLQG